jgi:hypothetical protein
MSFSSIGRIVNFCSIFYPSPLIEEIISASDFGLLKNSNQHFHGSVSSPHSLGHGKSSNTIGQFPHCLVQIYLAARISAI